MAVALSAGGPKLVERPGPHSSKGHRLCPRPSLHAKLFGVTNDWTVIGQIIRFDMEEDLTCLDLIAIPAGDPFSVVVATPRQASLPPGVAALERWSELGSLLQVSLADTRPERCLRICDGTSRIVFDAVMDYPCGRTLPGYPAA